MCDGDRRGTLGGGAGALWGLRSPPTGTAGSQSSLKSSPRPSSLQAPDNRYTNTTLINSNRTDPNRYLESTPPLTLSLPPKKKLILP